MKNTFGEYAEKGEYHIQLDKDWPYLPVYLAKMEYIHQLMKGIPKEKKILDLGCGEGILVREFHSQGYAIIGMDLNYESEYVKLGNLLNTGFEDGEFDVVLCLDVLEHLSFSDQEKAVKEISRLVKPGGTFIFSIPNLAHFASRLSFLVTGKLVRTSSIERHPGDRPISEYLHLISPYFFVRNRRGIFPTYPLLSVLTVWKPAMVIGLHRIYNALFAYPAWSFLNIFVFERR